MADNTALFYEQHRIRKGKENRYVLVGLSFNRYAQLHVQSCVEIFEPALPTELTWASWKQFKAANPIFANAVDAANEAQNV